MKQLTIVAVLLWGNGLCMAQDAKQEIQGVYLRIQGFTFNSGDPTVFDVEGASINGGGYAYIYHITDRFGLYQQMGFMGGPEQNGLKVKLLTEFQGFHVSKAKGPFLLYAKGGLGFTRYVFSGALSGVDSHFALNYGGGVEIQMKEGLNFLVEATRLTMGLPPLLPIALPGRNGWANCWQLATGIAIHF